MGDMSHFERDFGARLAEIERPRQRPTIWQRIWLRMAESLQRQAERDIARYMALNRGRFSDAAEREAFRNALERPWRPML